MTHKRYNDLAGALPFFTGCVEVSRNFAQVHPKVYHNELANLAKRYSSLMNYPKSLELLLK